jgi:GNAT superfamily N-acetyltransferase
MEMPQDWQLLAPNEVVIVDGEVAGNDRNGGSVAVHSLAIVPEYQGNGIGRALMDAYILYIKSAAVSANRIVIIAHDHLIRFYESIGFQTQGPSSCQFGGGGWSDMVRLSNM